MGLVAWATVSTTGGKPAGRSGKRQVVKLATVSSQYILPLDQPGISHPAGSMDIATARYCSVSKSPGPSSCIVVVAAAQAARNRLRVVGSITEGVGGAPGDKGGRAGACLTGGSCDCARSSRSFIDSTTVEPALAEATAGAEVGSSGKSHATGLRCSRHRDHRRRKVVRRSREGLPQI